MGKEQRKNGNFMTNNIKKNGSEGITFSWQGITVILTLLLILGSVLGYIIVQAQTVAALSLSTEFTEKEMDLRREVIFGNKEDISVMKEKLENIEVTLKRIDENVKDIKKQS